MSKFNTTMEKLSQVTYTTDFFSKIDTFALAVDTDGFSFQPKPTHRQFISLLMSKDGLLFIHWWNYSGRLNFHINYFKYLFSHFMNLSLHRNL